VLSLAVEVFLNQADTEMLAALSLPRHPDNIPQPVLHERIKVRGIFSQDVITRVQWFRRLLEIQYASCVSGLALKS
jgi:hypothetical protein